MKENNLFNIRELASELEADEGYLSLSYIKGLSPGKLRVMTEISLSPEEHERYINIVKKRKKAYPLQYAIGEWEFYGYIFKTDERALIPRPETELLIDLVLKDGLDDKVCLDLGTGSGIIALSLMCQAKVKKMIATDISKSALNLAKENEKRLKDFFKPDSCKMVQWYQMNGPSQIREGIDIVISNPPYIDPIEKESLQEELSFEPDAALFAGEPGRGGLKLYKDWIPILAEKLKPEGRVYFEIGYNQAQAIGEFFSESGFSDIEIFKDYSGLDRIIRACLKE